MIKKVVSLVLIVLIAVASFFVYSGWKKYDSALSEVPLVKKVASVKKSESYTPLDDVSKTFVQAITSVEDRRFYHHKGVDAIGLLRAIVTDIKKRELAEGGSTITQQLAKNLYFMGEETIDRKIAEMFTAIEIEKNYSKEEILELYINVIYYGSGYYNIYDASMGYFGKEPGELNDFEATLLAGVPNAPSKYSPKVNPELSYKRQEKVIDAMVKSGHITKEESKELILQQK